MRTRTHYQVLGISPSATAEQLRERFKELALQWHPDKIVLTGSKRAEERHRRSTEEFAEITQAYTVLRHEKMRREYDAQLKMLGVLCSKCNGAGTIKTARGFKGGVSEKKCDVCGGTGNG